jgi:flagellar motor protein MotB
MPTDKSVVEEHKEQATVVFDESMKNKKIEAIDKRVGLDFADEGIKSVPKGATVMFCSGQRVPGERFRKGYDEIAWECNRCGKMHLKGEECGRRNK